MKKKLLSIAALATMMLITSGCGNKSANATSETTTDEETAQATTEVAYETYTVEKYGVSVDVPEGMHRTDDPVMDNGAIWSFVTEDSGDLPIDASMSIGVYETNFGDYTQEKVEQRFNEDIPSDATQKELGDMEYTYSVEGEYINEYHRIVYFGNKSIDVNVAYTDQYADKMGGDVRDHIFASLKF